jgi:hypothetical protein
MIYEQPAITALESAQRLVRSANGKGSTACADGSNKPGGPASTNGAYEVDE